MAFVKAKISEGENSMSRVNQGNARNTEKSNGITQDWTVDSGMSQFFGELLGELVDTFHTVETIKSPLILDLDGDGVETTLLENGVAFDHNGNGFAEKTAWVNQDDGLLVRDINDNGVIDDGGELFGNNTVLKNGANATNGFTALAELDSNKDGKVDASDDAFGQLKVWKDANGNGVTDDGELLSLSDAGVSSIATNYSTSDAVDPQGNAHKQEGTYENTEGTTASIDDVWLKVDPLNTTPKELLEETEPIRALPDIKGFGNVHSLHQTMLRDESKQLQTLVEEFSVETNSAARRQLITDIIYEWTGVEDIDPKSRPEAMQYGAIMGDARKLEAMEEFFGEEYKGIWCWGTEDPNDSEQVAPLLLNGFDKLSDSIYSQLMAQTHLKEIYSKITLMVNDENVTTLDLSEVKSEILTLISEDEVAGKELLSQFTANMCKMKFDDLTDFEAFKETFVSLGEEYAHVIEGAIKLEIWGTAGPDTITGSSENEAIWGREGNDIIDGKSGDDSIWGDAGDDTITGGKGDDSIAGGAGNDYLAGGSGSDTYTFNLGDGQDMIHDYDKESGSIDTVVFGKNIVPENMILKRIGDDFEISLIGKDDKLTIDNYFNGSRYKIEKFVFENGTVWEGEFLQEKTLYVVGTEGDNVLYGSVGANIIQGFDGDDKMYGYDGNDVLYGGAGNDYMKGGKGDDDLVGNVGNDRLYGEDGADTLKGYSGNDSLYGGAGDDILKGGSGSDYMSGSYGNDTYIFNLGDGRDTIYDYDYRKDNVDTIKLGKGIATSDLVLNRIGDNLELSLKKRSEKLTLENYYMGSSYRIEKIEFADGAVWDTDVINGKTVYVTGSEGNDTSLQGSDGENIMKGLKGDDKLYGYKGNDLMYGGSGNDIMDGGDDDDFMVGNIGDDILYGQNGADTLKGYAGNDMLYGGSDNDILKGGTGDDYIEGGSGDDTYIFNRGDGQDIIAEYDTTEGNIDTIKLGKGIAASDLVLSRTGNDLEMSIKGGTDKLTLKNYYYSSYNEIEKVEFANGTVWDADTIKDQIVYVTGTEVSDLNLFGTEGANIMKGLDGDDGLYGYEGNDSMYGQGGNDFMDGGADDDYMVGEAGDDTLYGQDGMDTLEGGEGNDSLYGGTESDILTGGIGDDYMEGGSGDDTYIFNLGDGQDTIAEYDWASGNTDTISLGKGIATSDLTMNRIGYDLELSIKDGTDKLTLRDYYRGSYGVVEKVAFDDGTVWDTEIINSKIVYVTGGEGNDSSLYGSDGINIMNGLNGDDKLYGNKGNDFIYGGSGNDRIHGGEDDDLLVGNIGDDILYGDEGLDVLKGYAGNDTLIGGDGDDTLKGGSGDDYLDGGDGSDTYIFNLGDGIDTIAEYDMTAGSIDTIKLGKGIAASKVVLSRTGDDLELSIKDKTEKLILKDYYYSSYNVIEKIEFSNGTVWDMEAINKKTVYVVGGEADERALKGTDGKNIINGFDGDDRLYGYAGSDILYGDAGSDRLDGGEDDDTLYGGADDDRLYGRDGADALKGGTGDDRLYGNDGNDVLEGGIGNDYISGGKGNDTYVFNLGDGQDIFSDYGSVTESFDTLNFGEGIKASDIILNRIGDNLELCIEGQTDKVTIQDYYKGSKHIIETVKFADGTLWNTGVLNDKPVNIIFDTGQDMNGSNTNDILTGSERNDSIYGLVGNDVLKGEGGNDSLYGNEGDDRLTGGSGDDYMEGGSGDDTYIFNLGEGSDIIYDDDLTKGNVDTVKFGKGMMASDIVLNRVGDNLEFHVKDQAEILTLKDYYLKASCLIEKFKFADGTVWDSAAINQKIIYVTGSEGTEKTLYGTAGKNVMKGLGGDDKLYGYDGDDNMNGGIGNDYMKGGAGDDMLEGGTGNDVLYGQDGADTLNGGQGDDELYGGKDNDRLEGGLGNDYMDGSSGNDTYIFNLGFGQDIVYDYDSTTGNMDIVQMGEGIAASDIVLSRVGYDLQLAVKGTEDMLTLKSYHSHPNCLIEKIEFSDGTKWDALTISQKTVYVSGTEASDDTLEGTDSTNVMKGFGGDDKLYGYEGNDRMYGHGGNDLMVGGIGDDYIVGQDGDDTLYGQDGVDILKGYDGNDVLYGGDGEDELRGGRGDDYMNGGKGNDTYIFNLGYGQDTIYDYDSTSGNVDTLKLGKGIKASDITLSRVDKNLEFTIKDGTDKLIFEGYYNGSYRKIERIEFADGTVWGAEEIAEKDMSILGTVGNDTKLYGNEGINVMDGLEGNDKLYGFEGNDVISGGKGHDTIKGGTGDDTADGGEGNDTLYGEDGSDILSGGAGNDTLYGGNDADTLIGGIGNDSLKGGIGNDTYVFELGDGQDRLSDYDSTLGNIDTVKLGEGIAPSDILLSRIGDDLELSIEGTEDKITLEKYYGGSYYGIEHIEFANGTVWDQAFVDKKAISLTGNEGNNYAIYGTAGENIIKGLGGNDKMYGYDGDDTIEGGVGHDYAEGGTGDDTVIGGDGNDVLYGQDGADILNGESGYDTLYGGNGADALYGGKGDDYMDGGTGNDTYTYNLGDGQDVIHDYDSTSGNIDKINLGEGITASDITLTRAGNDLEFSFAGKDDMLTLRDYYNNPYYKIEQIEFADGTLWDDAAIDDNIVYVTGTKKNDIKLEGTTGKNIIKGLGGDDTLNGYEGDDILGGGSGKDTLDGGSGNDVLMGDEGDDILLGRDGADTLNGGTGDDMLNGESGDDTYIFEVGNGLDTISDYDTTAKNTDTLSFGEGIKAADVVLNRIGSDLQIAVSEADQVILKNYYTSPEYVIEKFEFADGTVWDASNLSDQTVNVLGTNESDTKLFGTASKDRIEGLDGADSLYGYEGDDYLDGGADNDTMDGGAGDDYLVGRSGDDTLRGQDGDDTLIGGRGDDKIYGGAGNDRLEGDDGNDTMYGEAGNDTYLFNAGDGQDIIKDYDNTANNSDTVNIRFDAMDLVFTKDEKNLQIGVNDSSDQLTIQSWYKGTNYHVETFKTADGKMLLSTQVGQLIQAMADFTQTAGISWNQAIDDKPEEVKTILAQYWTDQAN